MGVPQDLEEPLRNLVREAFGARATVTALHRIQPWTVARCRLAGVEGTATVLVKWLRSNPAGFRVDRRQIATEAAALELVGQLAPGVGPSLRGHSREHALLLIEDLAPRRTLHSVLADGLSPAGLAGLHAYASTMARLHAATTGREHHGPWDPAAQLPLGREPATELLDSGALTPATPAVRRDVEAALRAMEDPGPFAAFSNGDSGANNCLITAEGLDARLIDYEHACYRHVLLDVAALHVPASMWMTVADPVPLGVEQTYRRVVGATLPEALDDELYGSGLSAACALRSLSKLLRFEKLDGREPGHHSRRQLVSTIERTVATMDRRDDLVALKTWLADTAHALRARWPDADVEFPDDYSLREPFRPDH